MSRPRVFVDTSAWLALALKDDAHHPAAKSTLADLLAAGTQLVTTNHVAGETYTFLARAKSPGIAIAFIDGMVASLALDWIHADEQTEARAYEWLRRYRDQLLSFVDAVSFAVMERQGPNRAFTFDKHFEMAGFERVPRLAKR